MAENTEYDDYSEEEGDYEIPDADKTPFVILLGYLGSGKTTLVNHILKEQKDLKICVDEPCDVPLVFVCLRNQ